MGHRKGKPGYIPEDRSWRILDAQMHCYFIHVQPAVAMACEWPGKEIITCRIPREDCLSCDDFDDVFRGNGLYLLLGIEGFLKPSVRAGAVPGRRQQGGLLGALKYHAWQEAERDWSEALVITLPEDMEEGEINYLKRQVWEEGLRAGRYAFHCDQPLAPAEFPREEERGRLAAILAWVEYTAALFGYKIFLPGPEYRQAVLDPTRRQMKRCRNLTKVLEDEMPGFIPPWLPPELYDGENPD